MAADDILAPIEVTKKATASRKWLAGRAGGCMPTKASGCPSRSHQNAAGRAEKEPRRQEQGQEQDGSAVGRMATAS
jgi:hypothetical protein